MRTLKIFFILTLLSLLLFQCVSDKFKEQANKQFGDQNFKTAIALIELHKIRFGEYPASLDSLKYVGDWDRMIWTSVKYEKLDSGYVLDLIKGLDGLPSTLTLEYPDEFWNGLGLVRSNMKK